MEAEQLKLSFNVGGEPPTSAVLRLSGGCRVHREIDKGDELHLQVVDMDGTVVADGYGHIEELTFRDKRDPETNDIVATERIHTARIR